MPEQNHSSESHETVAGSPRLPDLRADHIPDDVLAQQDAEDRVADPEIDPLVDLTGTPEDVLTEMDAARRTAESQALTPTDDEVLDVLQDESEGA